MSQEADFDNTLLYNQLDAYPWSADEEFQGGLRAILGSVQDPAQIAHLTLRAKCYYFARKFGTPVDFDGYRHWIETRTTNGTGGGGVYDELVEGQFFLSPASQVEGGAAEGGGMGGMASAPKPASFAEICALIQEGKPIPGIKEIPDTILEGQASDASVEKRRKPWEKDGRAREQGSEGPSWMKKES